MALSTEVIGQLSGAAGLRVGADGRDVVVAPVREGPLYPDDLKRLWHRYDLLKPLLPAYDRGPACELSGHEVPARATLRKSATEQQIVRCPCRS